MSSRHAIVEAGASCRHTLQFDPEVVLNLVKSPLYQTIVIHENYDIIHDAVDAGRNIGDILFIACVFNKPAVVKCVLERLHDFDRRLLYHAFRAALDVNNRAIVMLLMTGFRRIC